MLIVIRDFDIQYSVTAANYAYYRSVSWFSAGLQGRVFLLPEIPSLSFPQNCKLKKNPHKIRRFRHPLSPIIVSYLLLDLTGLHWVLFLLSPVTCSLSRLILLFDIITVMSGHKVTNWKAPQCVILSIPITSCLLVPNNHQITSSSNTKYLVPSECKHKFCHPHRKWRIFRIPSTSMQIFSAVDSDGY